MVGSVKKPGTYPVVKRPSGIATTPIYSTPSSGGGGQGYSYVDPLTGKGYEVSPTGVKKEVIYGGGSGGGYSYVEPTTGKGYEVSPTGVKTEVIPKETTKQEITKQDYGEILPGYTGGKGGGVIFTKPGEVKKTNLPIWDVESKDFGEAFIEAGYAGGVSISRTPTLTTDIFGIATGKEILSKGQLEFNRAQIEMMKDVFREDIGTRREIISSISDINKFQEETAAEFKKNPFQFEGTPGFTTKEVEGGIEYRLGEEYFKTTKPYALYDLSLAKRKEFEEKYFDEEGFKFDQKEFNIYLGKAREKYKGELSTGARIAAQLGDIEIGAKQAVISFAEIGLDVGKTIYGNLGVKLIKPGEKIDITGWKEIKERFTTPSLGKEIMYTPVAQPLTKGGLKFVGELFAETPAFTIQTIPMAIGAYGAGTTRLGGMGSTLKILSPIRIKEGIFTPVAYEMATTKDIPKQFSLTSKGEAISFTKYSSKDFGFTLESTQFSKNLQSGLTGGKSFTQQFNVPYIQIGKGGASTTFGTTNIDTIMQFEGKGYQSGLFKGFGSGISESDIFGVSAFKDVPVIGLSQNLLNVGRFKVFRSVGGLDVSGFKQKTYLKTFDLGKEYYTGIESPVRTRGVIFDISDLFKTRDIGVKIFRGGGTKTPLSTTFQVQIPKIDTINIPKAGGIVSPIVDLKTFQQPTSIWTGTGLYERYYPSELLVVSKPIKPIVSGFGETGFRDLTGGGKMGGLITIGKFGDLGVGTTRFRDLGLVSTRDYVGVKPRPNIRTNVFSGVSITPISNQLIIQSQAFKTPTKTIQKEITTEIIVPKINIPFTFDFGRGFGALPPIPFPMGIFEGRKGYKRTKQKMWRQPSWAAATLGIKSQKPLKYEFTGLIERPILISRKNRKKK